VFTVAQRPEGGTEPGGPTTPTTPANDGGAAPPPTPPEPAAPPGAGPPAAAVSTDPGPAKVGLVDILVVEAKWEAAKGMAQYRVSLETELLIQDREIECRRRYPFLLAEEIEELCQLLYRTPGELTDKQKSRARELGGLSDTRAEEYQALLDTVQRTPEQQERFGILTEMREARTEDVQTHYDALLKRRGDMEDELLGIRDQLIIKIRLVTRDLAPQLGLNYVFRTESVLWGGQDVTDAIVKELNRRYPKLEDATKPEP
jgi:Skp family chaperone for outer membrane proteins